MTLLIESDIESTTFLCLDAIAQSRQGVKDREQLLKEMDVC